MKDFTVIEYSGERIPVVPVKDGDDLELRSCDERHWRVSHGKIYVDGEYVPPSDVTVTRPGPQDYYVFQSLTDFDELDPEVFKPLSYPIPDDE